jgi:hypothetical protein
VFGSIFAYLAFADDGSGGTTPVSAAWNPSVRSSDCVLSNSNLTASATATVGGVVATVGGMGKFYFEVRVDAIGSTFGVGVADGLAAIVSTGSWLGSSGNGRGATYRSDTSVEFNGGFSATGSSFTTADIIGVAVDVPNKLIWWAKNNGHRRQKPFNSRRRHFPGVPGGLRHRDRDGAVHCCIADLFGSDRVHGARSGQWNDL